MVLPVNLDTGADLLAKLGSYQASSAQAQYTASRTDQQMAETQEYVSKTQKELRKTRAEAEMSMAKAEQMKAEVTLAAPDLYRQVYESGMGAKLQQNLAEKGEAFNTQIVTAFGDGVKTAEDYAAKYTQLLNNNPDLVKELKLPSLEQVQKDPSQIPKVNMLVGTAWQNNAEFKQKQALQDTEIKATVGMKRETIAAEKEMLDDKLSVTQSEGAADRENKLENTRLLIEGRKDVASLQGEYRLKQVQAKKNGTALKLRDVMPGGTDGLLVQLMPAVAAMSEELGTDLSDESLKALATESSVKAQAVWMKRNAEYMAGNDTAPPLPAEIAMELARDKLIDPKQVQAGGYVSSGDYRTERLQTEVEKQLSPAQFEKYRAATPEQKAQIEKKLGL